MSLSDVPDEILLNIFSFLTIRLNVINYDRMFNWHNLPGLSKGIDQLTLSYASRASKKLRRVALPALYHTIPRTSLKLMRNLTEKRYLVSLVKAIDLTVTWFHGITVSSLQEAFEAARRRLTLSPYSERYLSEVINSLTEDVNGQVVHSDHVEDTLAAIFLLLLPNIETLAFACNVPNPVIARILRGADHASATGAEGGSVEQNQTQTTSNVLLRLRDLHLRHWATEYTINISGFLELLLPTVEALYTWSISWELNTSSERAWSALPVQPKLGLKHVEILDAVLNGPGLEYLLRRSPGLKTLRAIWTAPYRTGDFPLDYEIMGAALRRYGHGLEELILDLTDNQAYLDGWSGGRLGSLRELVHLKILRLPQRLMVGEPNIEDFSDDDVEGEQFPVQPRLTLDDVLPCSLERLSLITCQDDNEDLDEQICELVREGGRLTRLQQIRVRRDIHFTRDAAALGFTHSYDRGEMLLVKRN